jgi:hypothetical protein
MSERRTDTSGTDTSGTGTGSTDASGTGTGSTDASGTGTGSAGRPDRRSQHEQDNEEFQAGTGYEPSTNQAQDEPLPASHHDDDGREETARRRGEPVRDDSSPRTQDGRRETGQGRSERPGKG